MKARTTANTIKGAGTISNLGIVNTGTIARVALSG